MINGNDNDGDFKPGQMDMESNMDENNSWENDDEDDTLINEFREMEFLPSQEEIANPPANASAEEEDKGPKGLFEDEDDDSDDDSDDDTTITDEELEVFNKKLGTNFKSVDDLKSNFQKEEQQSEKQKEDIEIKKLSNNVELFDSFIRMDNETLVKNQFISDARAAGKDINNQEVLDDIENKIQGSKDLQTLDSQANAIRSNLHIAKSNAQKGIDGITQKRQLEEQTIAKQNVTSLQNAFSDIFESGEFMGVKLDQETVNKVYKSVRSEEFFETVNKDQGLIAKVAMFVHLQDQIAKRTSMPTQSDKTRNAFEALAGSGSGKARNIAQAQGSASSQGIDNVLAFIK